MRLRALALVGCMLFTGSATGALGGRLASADPTVTSATPPERPPAPSAVLFADNPSIVNSRAQPFDSWSRLANGDALALYFTVGSPECSGVHANVSETSETVAVEFRSGTLPEAVGRMCTMIAVFGSVDVPLQNPLGDRQVLSVY